MYRLRAVKALKDVGNKISVSMDSMSHHPTFSVVFEVMWLIKDETKLYYTHAPAKGPRLSYESQLNSAYRSKVNKEKHDTFRARLIVYRNHMPKSIYRP